MSDPNFITEQITVGELKTILSGFPDDYHVVLAKDAEGNDFSPLIEANPALYEAGSTWSGEASLYKGDAYGLDDEDPTYNDELPVESANSVVLWPTN